MRVDNLASMSKQTKAKVLFLDIETAPIEAHVWKLYENDVALNQIVHDWSVLSWCAKWKGSKKLHYADVRSQKNKRDDSKILKPIWKLINEADIIVGQNSIAFDTKKLNARFVINEMKPPSHYRQIDTKVLAKKVFGFTSNRLEYLADKLCKKYKKLKHKRFAGHEMWVECLRGNQAAWKEMEKYNKHDVLALEELYKKLIAWDNSVSMNVYSESNENVCSCGSFVVQKRGFKYTNTGKFQHYTCGNCGKWWFGKTNLLSLTKKRDLLK
jgi:hypothetical protein